MKETEFIEQNKAKWAHLEAQIKTKRKLRKYEHLGEQFVQLSEDLSYAQTYYPRRSVRLYLNGLAQRLYKNVFNARTKDKESRFRFWTHELPTALWESRLELSLALIIFLIAAFVGVVSSQYEDSFATQILGERYVNMTEENIAKGDPMGVYKDMEAVPMFFMIMYNNLQVLTFFFVMGILFGVGTVGLLFSNGVMLGVFQYFFFQRSLGLVSMLTIWQHGTIEIASAVVAGGAGLVLGKSMVFPGTLPRNVSLKFGFLKGLKIILGVAPLVVIAAFIESFFTRFDGLPLAIRLISIIVSLAFIIGYYVVLPIKRGRRLSLLKDVEENYSESHIDLNLNLNKLKNNGEHLSDALIVVQQQLGSFMRVPLVTAATLAIVVLVFMRPQFEDYLYFTPFKGMWYDQIDIILTEVWNRLDMFKQFFVGQNMLVILILAPALTWLNNQMVNLLNNYLPAKELNTKHILPQSMFIALLLVPFAFTIYYGYVFIALAMPLTATATYIQRTSAMPFFKALGKAAVLQVKLLSRYLGMVVLSVLFGLLVMFLVQSPTIYVLFELGNNFIGFTEGASSFMVDFALLFLVFVTLFCGLGFLSLNAILNYQSVVEINECNQLTAEINNINTNKLQ